MKSLAIVLGGLCAALILRGLPGKAADYECAWADVASMGDRLPPEAIAVARLTKWPKIPELGVAPTSFNPSKVLIYTGERLAATGDIRTIALLTVRCEKPNLRGEIRLTHHPKALTDGDKRSYGTTDEVEVRGGDLQSAFPRRYHDFFAQKSFIHGDRYIIYVELSGDGGAEHSLTKQQFAALVVRLAEYTRQVLEGKHTQLELEFRFLEPSDLQADDFRTNFKRRMPLGVSVVAREASGSQSVPKPNQRIRVTIKGDHNSMWVFPLMSWRIAEWPLAFEAQPGSGGQMVPYTTDANGTVFVDFREGYVLDGDGHRKVLDADRLGEALWKSIKISEASLRLEITAEAYEGTDADRRVLATTSREFALKHTAEIQWIKKYDPDETGGSYGVEILSKRIDPRKQSRQSLGRISPSALDVEELRSPIRLLPNDSVRLGRYDKVRIRCLLDDAGALWVMRGNKSFLGPQGYGEVMLAARGGPAWQDQLERWSREYARSVNSLWVGGAVTAICCLEWFSEQMTIKTGIRSKKTAGMFAIGIALTAGQAKFADYIVDPNKVEWLLIRPKGTVLGFDVAEGEARVYLLSGAAAIEDIRGNQREIQRGQLLNVGGRSHFQVAAFDDASLPESLKSLMEDLRLEGAEETVETETVANASESWPDEWPIVATSPNWDGGGKPGFYADAVNAGAAIPPPGRHGIVVLHPPSADKPAKLVRRLIVPRNDPTLRLTVAANHRPLGDWRLRVTVNGTPLSADLPVEGKEGWRRVDYDLRPFAGQEAAIEVEAWATGWYYEYVFFDSIEIIAAEARVLASPLADPDEAGMTVPPADQAAPPPPAALPTALAALRSLGAEISGTPPHVHGVRLSSPNVRPEQLAPLASLAGVTWLMLSDAPITDAGLTHVRGLKDLRRLSINNAGITDAGLRHLQHLTELRILHLDDNRITNAGLEHLNELHQLETLTLRNTQVTLDGARRLKTALPNCTIGINGQLIE